MPLTPFGVHARRSHSRRTRDDRGQDRVAGAETKIERMLLGAIRDPFARRQQPVGIAHVAGASLSGPRMGPAVDVPDPLAGEMRVQLRGGDTRMPEQLLDDAQVGPALEQMRRERVTQRVRADPVGEPGRASAARLTAAHACWRASRPPRSPRNSGPPRSGATWCVPAATARGPVDPAPEPVERDVADRDQPLLVALADDADERAVDRQVLAVEPDRLADPQAGRVQQLEQRAVAQGVAGVGRRCRRGRRRRPPRAVARSRRRSASRAGGATVAAGRGARRRRRDQALAVGEPVEALERGRASAEAARREAGIAAAAAPGPGREVADGGVRAGRPAPRHAARRREVAAGRAR